MKKIISLCLLAIMLMSVLASCNDTSNTDDTVSTNVTTEDNITTEPTTEAPTVMKEYDLTKFTIIYDEVYSLKLATDLRTKFKEELGIDIPLKKGNSTKEYEYELIIGNTPREVSSLCFDVENPKYLTAKGVVCDNGKVQLLGIDKKTLDASIDYFFNNIITKGSNIISLPEKGEDIVEITHESISIPKRKDDSSIRFVTNNILDQAYTPSWDRLMGLVSAYVYLDADIYTLQEVGDKWHSTYKLTERMEWLGYSLVTNNEKVACPIFYKTERFELVEGGYDVYNTDSLAETAKKSYAFACLKEKATGKKLIVISTHLIANGKTSDEVKANREIHRQECSKQLLTIAADLQKKHGNAPVMIAGDFNSRSDSQTYKIMSSELYSARDNSEKKVNMKYNTENSLGKEPKQTGECIDHVFYSKSGITAKHFETVVSPYTYDYSDHVPALLDFELN